MKYILNNQYCLRGYKNLPFAIYNKSNGETFFFTKDEYRLILDCDGKSEINIKELNEKDHKFFRSLISAGMLSLCSDGNLKDYQEYHDYEVFYKDNAQWSITGKCNYRCKHCYMSAPHAKYDQMSYDDCLKVIDELDRCGVRKIHLTGGEPLIHPDFEKIIEQLTAKNLFINTLYTNGMLLNQKIIDLLKKNNPDIRIQISFDGLGYHDWLRGVDKAEEKAINAIKICVDNNITCDIAMVLFKDNADSIKETVRYLSSLKVNRVNISAISKQGEWLPYYDEHGLGIPETFEKYLEYIPQFFEDKLDINLALSGMFSYDKNTHRISSTYEKPCYKDNEDKFYLCKSLKKAFYISSNGKVLPCTEMMSTVVEDNALSILTNDLKDIINDSYLNEISNRKAKDYLNNVKKCQSCKYKYQCLGGCEAKALVSNGRLYSIDKEACDYFLLGYKTKKDELLNLVVYR